MNRTNIFLQLVLLLFLLPTAIYTQTSDITTCAGQLINVDDLQLTVNPTNMAPLDDSVCPYTPGDLVGYLNCMADAYPLGGGSSYGLSIIKDGDYLNGVSTIDLVHRHLLQIESLDNVCNVVSADVNGDNKINVKDLIEMRQLILGITSEFKTPSWRFFEGNGLNLSVNNSDELQFEEGDLPVSSLNVIGLKVGDVNFSAVP